VLVYGAFALFSLARRWYDIPLALVVVRAIEFYRHTVNGLHDSTVELTGLTLSPGQRDVLVLWVGAGRIVSRSYVLLTRETLHPNFEYKWFSHWPFLPLTRLNRWFGRISRGRAYWRGLGLSSLFTTMLWPLFIWTFLVNPTVNKRERWRTYTGGTPHPSDRSKVELPPVGDELKTKFSKEESTVLPCYNAVIVMLTYVAVEAIAVSFFATVNLVLGALA
jgi:hypothetical protein